MKFVTLAKTFETVDPHRPLIKVTLEKGTRFAIRKGNMFENGLSRKIPPCPPLRIRYQPNDTL
jgi:hypothetical protein